MCLGRSRQPAIPPIAPAIPPPAPVPQAVGKAGSLKKRSYKKRPSLRRKTSNTSSNSQSLRRTGAPASNTPY
jgi:hypothetical protein